MKNKTDQDLQQYISDFKLQIAASNDRSQLLKTLTDSLLSIFKFTGIFIQSVDRHSGTYYPFLIDPISNARSLSEFRALANARSPLTDTIVRDAMTSSQSFTVILESLINDPKLPFWIETNIKYGAREVLVCPLRIKKETVGICYVWSDNTNLLTKTLAEVMDNLSNELGFAVSNIIINEVQNQQQIINDLLLSFSNDLVKVKNRADLGKAINSGLKDLLHFDSFIITNMTPEEDDYSIFFSSSALQTEQQKLPAFKSFNKGIYDLLTNSRTPVIIDMQQFDLLNSPQWVKSYYQAGAREMMVKLLPISDLNQFGLVLLSNKKNMFEASDRAVLQRISNHVTTSIANILANEEVERKEKDKTFLLSFSHDMATVRNLDELSNAIARGVGKLSEITRYSIRLLNADQLTTSIYLYDEEIKKAIYDGREEILTSKYPVKDGVQDLILEKDHPVVFDLQNWIDNGKAPSYFHLWKSLGINSSIGTALRTGCTNHGILWTDTKDPSIELLDGICTQVSIAISNVKANEKVLDYKRQLENENQYLQEEIKAIYKPLDTIGTSEAMQKVYKLMSFVSPSNATVLLCGETGTGKEVIARGIHESSPRKNKLMVKINCAALPANLIESELFGYEKGAFTGAMERRIGKFELAHNGTLFLDEIGELPLELQVKLLRVIQEREFERLGGKVTIKVDVRIITATNRDLLAEVSAGRFRSDLYYRLNVFPISLPPLRDRREDISLLADYFVVKFNKNHSRNVTSIPAATMHQLKTYNWPGNVRELEHVIERSVLLSDTKIMSSVFLPELIINPGDTIDAVTLEGVERQHIIDTIKRCSGKISGQGGAAELLNMPSSTLNSKMKKLGITAREAMAQ
jgi:formate hydrogenlyase transcriptional activator